MAHSITKAPPLELRHSECRSTFHEDQTALYQEIKLSVILPNSTTGTPGVPSPVTVECTTGDTISDIKRYLFEEHGMDYESTSLFHSGRTVAMMDPMSLNDFPEVLEKARKGEEILIETRCHDCSRGEKPPPYMTPHPPSRSNRVADIEEEKLVKARQLHRPVKRTKRCQCDLL